jgi:hypothetical protein
MDREPQNAEMSFNCAALPVASLQGGDYPVRDDGKAAICDGPTSAGEVASSYGDGGVWLHLPRKTRGLSLQREVVFQPLKESR